MENYDTLGSPSLIDTIENKDTQSETLDILEGDGDDENSLEKLKAKIALLEQEASEVSQANKAKEESQQSVPTGPEADIRSVYVGNVEYETTTEELKSLFQTCGEVTRVTILCDKWTGQPKGFGYVQFKNADDIENAVLLNGSEFKNRVIKVLPKRTNIPGFSRGRGGMMGAPRGRGRFRGRSWRSGGYRGRGYRGRGRGHTSYYSPYA